MGFAAAAAKMFQRSSKGGHFQTGATYEHKPQHTVIQSMQKQRNLPFPVMRRCHGAPNPHSRPGSLSGVFFSSAPRFNHILVCGMTSKFCEAQKTCNNSKMEKNKTKIMRWGREKTTTLWLDIKTKGKRAEELRE